MARHATERTTKRSRIATRHGGKVHHIVLISMAIVATVILGTLLSVPSAHAQQACGDRTEILKELAKFHSEKPQSIGLSTDGTLFEVLVSTTGSRTLLVSYPNRLTCLIAAGEIWESLPVVAQGSSA